MGSTAAFGVHLPACGFRGPATGFVRGCAGDRIRARRQGLPPGLGQGIAASAGSDRAPRRRKGRGQAHLRPEGQAFRHRRRQGSGARADTAYRGAGPNLARRRADLPREPAGALLHPRHRRDPRQAPQGIRERRLRLGRPSARERQHRAHPHDVHLRELARSATIPPTGRGAAWLAR
jgi:hypothetical protein